MDGARAVFFDKDGTLIEDVPYNVNPDLIILKEGASAALNLLREVGFKLFIASNQSGVARGYFAEKQLEAVWERLDELTGIEFDGIYYCPHHPAGVVAEYSFACDCRKPEPGLLLQAAREHEIDLKSSWFIGDTLSDVEAGNRAGCQTILINDQAVLLNFTGGIQKPLYNVLSLQMAVNIILKIR